MEPLLVLFLVYLVDLPMIAIAAIGGLSAKRWAQVFYAAIFAAVVGEAAVAILSEIYFDPHNSLWTLHFGKLAMRVLASAVWAGAAFSVKQRFSRS